MLDWFHGSGQFGLNDLLLLKDLLELEGKQVLQFCWCHLRWLPDAAVLMNFF